MITLRPMTDSEFAAFKDFMYQDYAEAQARGAGVPVDQVRELAHAQIDHLMQDGLRSPAHRYWKVVTPEGTVVGDLSLQVETDKRQAFIYFIGIDQAYRSRGYAQQALAALEDLLRTHGVTHISLSVFGDNVVARHVYERMGYQPSAILMRKDL
jgi:RimJ/RimL family protein N-acetyltransferase